MMRAADLKRLREDRGWSQAKTARRLLVSQPYLSLIEAGDRALTSRLTRKCLAAFGLSPSLLPLPASFDEWGSLRPDLLAGRLAALGYPYLSYLRAGSKRENPAAVLIWALSAENLEPRLVEALPWLLLSFDNLDVDWMVREAKLHDLQNRLGFVVALAGEVFQRGSHFKECGPVLAELASRLERCRLASEGTLCEEAMSNRMREWVHKSRSVAAKHWNMLSAWKAEHLRYAQ